MKDYKRLRIHIAEKELLETHFVTAKELVIVGDKVVFRK